MTESYLVGGDSLQTITDTILAAQSFIPTEYHWVKYVDLDIFFSSSILDIELSIHPLKLDGTPYPWWITTSFDWDRRNFKANQVTRVRFWLYGCELFAGYSYAIVLRLRVTPPEPIRWQYDATASRYPRGQRLLSIDNGSTWTKYTTQDHMFAEFGWPSHPYHTPPNPPVDKTAISGLSLFDCPPLVIISTTTIDPCHLFCFHTLVPPRKHYRGRDSRGLKAPWDFHLCFVAYQETEQNEPGDTTIHTFTIRPWHSYQHRYYTFRGTINGQLSPSTNPIFEHSPTIGTPPLNTLFSDWPDPNFAPLNWYKDFAGPGPSHWHRQEYFVMTPPYAPMLTADNAITRTYIKQRGCARPYRGLTLNFDFWFRTIGYGQFELIIDQTGPGAWRWRRAYGPTGWLHRNFTRYIDPNAEFLIISFECMSITGAHSTAVFDGVTITEV